MQGLWLEEQQFSLRDDLLLPEPGTGQALIRVRLAGICSTDLELVRGYYPFTGVPGHEFIGEVIHSSDAPHLVGKRVVGEINISCGTCPTCRMGLPRHCEQRKTLGIHAWNGSFAQYLVLPVANLHPVPQDVPDEMAVFTEPLAAAHEIIEQAPILPGERVLVIGAGRLGLLVAAVLKSTPCQLEVLARHARQFELLEKQGVRAIARLDEGGKRYDVVVDATGSPDGFRLAAQAVRPRGRIFLKSTYQGDTQVNLSRLVVNEVTLIGSRCGSFEPAIELLVNRQVDPRLMIEAEFPLRDGLAAFRHAAQPGILKVLLRP